MELSKNDLIADRTLDKNYDDHLYSLKNASDQEYSTNFYSFKSKIDQMNSDINFLQTRLNSIENLASKNINKPDFANSRKLSDYSEIIKYTENNKTGISTLNLSANNDANKFGTIETSNSAISGNFKKNKSGKIKDGSILRSVSVYPIVKKNITQNTGVKLSKRYKSKKHTSSSTSKDLIKKKELNLNNVNNNHIKSTNVEDSNTDKFKKEQLAASFYQIINDLKNELKNVKSSFVSEIALVKEKSLNDVEIAKKKFQSVLKTYEKHTLQLKKENKDLKNKLDKINLILNCK